MKRKFISLLLLCTVLSIFFSSCNNATPNVPSVKGAIVFKTLTVDNNVVMGTVENSQEDFDFNEEIEKGDNVDFYLSKEKNGSEIIRDNVVFLNEGDNSFYLFEVENGITKNVYTIVLHRNCIFTVVFDDSTEKQGVEEGERIAEPVEQPSKVGYNFIGWDYDFSKPVASNLYIKAIWVKKTVNSVLIVERNNEESQWISNLLSSKYDVTVKNINSETLPSTVKELRSYEQVILVNVSNSDIRTNCEGFDLLLQSYVHDYCGSLFTVGGNDEAGNANVYNRSDLYGTVYQQMLPVQAINYTPPVGVMVIIDNSGSMGVPNNRGDSYLDMACDGARACLEGLGDKDYMGIMTLDSTDSLILAPTPIVKKDLIHSAITEVNAAGSLGGTAFTPALTKAGEELNKIKFEVSKLHVIIISDGLAGDGRNPECNEVIKKNYEDNGITLSIIAIGVLENTDTAVALQAAIDATGEEDSGKKGKLYLPRDIAGLIEAISNDLSAPMISEFEEFDFYPTIVNSVSPLVYDLEKNGEKLIVTLGGFYGVRARSDADLILAGEYGVPIYAQWKYGSGMVGSFMCDLNGNWSNEFISSQTGATFIERVVANLIIK